jgi:hypothetical protein
MTTPEDFTEVGDQFDISASRRVSQCSLPVTQNVSRGGILSFIKIARSTNSEPTINAQQQGQY